MSVRPSVDKVSGTFWKKKLLAQFISYLVFTIMGWVSWPLYIFVFLTSILALWWPNIWPKMGFAELFGKTIGPIHFIPGIYPYEVSLLTPIRFRVPGLIFGPLVAKYLAEMGFPELLEKTIGSIHVILDIYPYGVSLLTPIQFRVPSLISALWWPNIWPKMGFPGLFDKNYCLNSFHTWHLPLWGESLDPYTFSCSWPYFRPSGGQIFGRNGVSGTFGKKILAQFISYLVCTLMGWVSWPLYTFVFLASLSALWWPNIRPKNGVSGTFWKTIGSIDFILYLAFTLMGWVFWPLFIFVFLASFSALWWPNIWHSHLCSTRMQNINLYWIFLVEVGSDQSGGILSPFMDRACCCWNPHYSDVRMNIMASQIIGDSAVCLIVRLDWYKKKSKLALLVLCDR